MTKEIIYGRQPVREAIRAGRRDVARLLVSGGGDAPVVAEVAEAARARGIPIRPVERFDLDRLCGDGNHQGMAAEAGEYPYVDEADLLPADDGAGAGDPPFLLLLDHIEDPQNLGAMLRSADAAGVHGVIIPKDRAAAVTPAAVRASAGAAEHVRVARVTNLVQMMRKLKESGVWIAGVELMPESKPYTEADLKGPIGLVIGSEGRGLGRLVRETCDFHIQVPMHGHVNSLNASVACALALFEVRRQRGAGCE